MMSSSQLKGWHVRRSSKSEGGFKVIEMMLALMAFLLLLSIVLIGLAKQQAARRDVQRTASVSQLQKALALYSSTKDTYPVMKTCITGTDSLTKELVDKKFLDDKASFKDPRWPDDLTQCLFYIGTGSTYTLRYTLETDREQPKGEHTVGP
jgi:type II secretory pathway pseudopilin PulG